MNQDFSIVTLVLHASVVVQLVMAGLMLASLSSWTVIFGKLFGLRKTKAANDEFERDFWAGRNLNDLYTEATERPSNAPMERIFASGMREFFKLREKRVMDPGALLDGARRAMRASFQRELDAIESNLSFLASVGSVSPASCVSCRARSWSASSTPSPSSSSSRRCRTSSACHGWSIRSSSSASSSWCCCRG